jgi:putative ABC transport system ATP-binding protein
MIATCPLLEAHNLGRRHPDGGRWLLEDVSLAVHAGRPLALGGPSGSGKTLLLRALALLDPLDAGSVLWQGRRLASEAVPHFRHEVIYLHQRPTLLGETVQDALARPFSLAVHRDRRFDPARIVDLLGQLYRGEAFLAKRTDDLSGGEMQIVALLRAVQLDPILLLLDEPTAALDRRTARAVEELLRNWVAESAGQRRSYVWVSHDAVQAGRVSQTVLHIQDGRLVPEPRP